MGIDFREKSPEKRVLRYWRELVPEEGGSLLCAVSGGADSMCLLAMMLSLSEELGLEVKCGHYNHRLRGAESDRDEAFVRDFCLLRGIEFFRDEGDVASAAEFGAMSIEEAARKMRYDALHRMADLSGCGLIATAHTADDNAETVLINLARGTGLLGLCGIPPRRGRIIRPLLCLTRPEVEVYLTERGTGHVEDSTNASDVYGRNRVRHHAVPALNGINLAFAENTMRAGELLRQDEEFLSGLAEEFIRTHDDGNRLPADKLFGLPGPVFSRVLRIMCKKSLPALHIERVRELCGENINPSARLDLPGMSVRREYGCLSFQQENAGLIPERCIFPGDDFLLYEGGPRIKCHKGEKSSVIHKRLNILCFKTQMICGNMSVRSRLPGDKYRPEGRNCTKTLKELFMEARIPRDKRDLIPVFYDQAGIIGAGGFGAAQHVSARDGDACIIMEIEDKTE